MNKLTFPLKKDGYMYESTVLDERFTSSGQRLQSAFGFLSMSLCIDYSLFGPRGLR